MVTARQDFSEIAPFDAERARIADDMVRRIRETLGTTGASTVLAEASEYVLSVMGKLMRPMLMLEACRAGGGDPEKAFPAALGTEYGHIASLVHDDIIDGDHERRGQQTVHTRYDVATAILTGDMFIFHTFLNFTECEQRGVSSQRVLEAVRMLSETCIAMCQGQALEAAMAGDLSMGVKDYLTMIALKTASFCRAAAHIGALLGGADDSAVAALNGFGEHLGMTFQIIDDMLPYTSDARATGKPSGSDITNGRVTLPIIYAVQSSASAKREFEAIFRSGATHSPDVHRRLRRILGETRALDRTRAVAYRYTSKAKRQLDLLPHSPSRERLRGLADMLVMRQR